MSKLTELTAKLSEILQIDRPDLDFGIYRVINARADEIKDYLARRLPERVKAALGEGGQANLEALKPKLAEAIAGAQAAGFNPDDSPKVKEIRQQIEAAAGSAVEYENAVYSHLLTFFSRYYDQGDFISQRRYKGDTYAIPYAGEEVVLHWANKDQYYTKSGEAFSNYSFRLEDGRLVHFRLTAADTAKDNRKDNDKERRFVLIEPMTVTRTDEDGETFEEVLTPVAEEDDALVLRFAYLPMPKGTKQGELLTRAIETALADAAVKARWQDLTRRAPTDKSPLRTVLEKHLTDYTAKNTADYFIHKDLGGFLRRELDFYIKNEVMNLDDLQNAAAFAAIETQLSTIQTLRAIALDLIAFLAQLENFQKRMWLKKKFVVASHYCLTLDRIPEELWPAVAANPRQWSQWRALGMWTGPDGSFHHEGQFGALVIDTSLYDATFKAELLKNIPNIDSSIDGILIHGDNFQALRLLSNSYRGKVMAAYIDPPYNTDASSIIYKNGYKDSSWGSLLNQGLSECQKLLKDEGVIAASIDDTEVSFLRYMLASNFDKQVGTAVVRANPQSRKTSGKFSPVHEYALFYGKTDQSNPGTIGFDQKKAERYPLVDEIGNFAWMNFIRAGNADLRIDRPKSFYPIWVYSDGRVYVPKMNWNDEKGEYRIEEDQPADVEVVMPVRQEGHRTIEKRWQRSHTRVRSEYNEYRSRRDSSGIMNIDFKTRMDVVAAPTTWWDKPEYASANYGAPELNDIMPNSGFDYPKVVRFLEDVILSCGASKPDDIVLDFFAGSGSTGNAAISLSRKNSIRLRYVLIEQGEYFDSILRPRIQKAVYSSGWKSGRPTSSNTGISHGFKVLKIESYEDTLNNLALTRTGEQSDLLDNLAPTVRDDYLLRYMMDIETRGSLLSVADFRKPFDYQLRVAVDSAGAAEDRPVDLVETFNYLIGLTVKTIDLHLDRGFALVRGVLPDRQTALILWRDCDKLDYEGLLKLCDTLAINPADSEHDVVYVNGDHTIPTVATADDAAGGETKVLKLRQIEPAFLDAMFSMDEAS